jgi:DNA-binding MarR family transcriptional regulator
MKHPLEAMVGFQMVRVANMALRIVNASYGDLQIRHPDAAVLMVIEANPGVTQSTIGRMIKMERSNVAPVITRLSGRAWIERRPGRGKTIGLYLSSDGAAIMPQIHAASRAGEDLIFDALGKEGYAAMLRGLRRIT